MTLSLISAIGKNNELGKDNQLLWDIPEDMKHFRKTTRGHAVIMGRKTFESIGKTLPNRRNVVITRDENYSHDGVEIVHSLDEALKIFSKSDEEVFVIGGAEIYKQAIEKAGKLYITHVDKSFPDADTFFPEINKSTWKINKEYKKEDIDNPYTYTFKEYIK